jgi:hypothetical protein
MYIYVQVNQPGQCKCIRFFSIFLRLQLHITVTTCTALSPVQGLFGGKHSSLLVCRVSDKEKESFEELTPIPS